MMNLLISEIKYNKLLWLLNALIPLVFVLFALLGIETPDDNEFIENYFWSLFVGFGIYMVTFAIWNMRRKENRQRAHGVLPVSAQSVGSVKALAIVIPFIYAAAITISGKLYLDDSQVVHISRILAQLGLLLIFIASYDFVENFYFTDFVQKSRRRELLIFLAVICLICLTVGVMYLIIKFISGGNEDEPMFVLWGIIIAASSVAVYQKRNYYL